MTMNQPQPRVFHPDTEEPPAGRTPLCGRLSRVRGPRTGVRNTGVTEVWLACSIRVGRGESLVREVAGSVAHVPVLFAVRVPGMRFCHARSLPGDVLDDNVEHLAELCGVRVCRPVEAPVRQCGCVCVISLAPDKSPAPATYNLGAADPRVSGRIARGTECSGGSRR